MELVALVCGSNGQKRTRILVLSVLLYICDFPDSHLIKKMFAAVNADWTNRHHSINTSTKLVDFLADLTLDDNNLCQPDALVVSEMGPTACRMLARTLAPTYRSVVDKIGYDHLQLLWDSRVFQSGGPTQVSTVGKYIVQPLTWRDDPDTSAALVAIHLPAVKNIRVARRCLVAAIDRLMDDFKEIIIAGDANMQPAELAEEFPDFKCCFRRGDVTTRAGTAPDNILAWKADDGVRVRRTQVLNNTRKLSHFPIWANLD